MRSLNNGSILFGLLLVFLLSVGNAAFADVASDLIGISSSPETQDNPDRQISVNSNASVDRAIQKRIKNIFSNLDSLKTIEVAVDAGVVTLSGEVLTNDAEREATTIAGQVEGVVEVKNELQQVYSMKERLRHTYEQMKQGLLTLAAAAPLLGVAILVLLIFWVLASWVTRWDGLFKRITPNLFIADLVKQLARGIVLIIGVLIALEIMDATAILGALLGAVGLIGLVVGFAIRDTVENYVASILLSLRQPFSPNDHIVLGEYEGRVVRLTPRATILMTMDGNHIRLPNTVVYKGIIINYSRNPERRFSFDVGVDTAVDLTSARSLAIRTLEKTQGVLERIAPTCQVKTLGDSNIVLTVYGWVDQAHYDLQKVRSASIQAVKEAFDLADFEMPEPIYRLRMEGLNKTLQLVAETPSGVGGVEQTDKAENVSKEVAALNMDHALKEKTLDVKKDEVIEAQIAEEAAREEDLLDENCPKE